MNPDEWHIGDVAALEMAGMPGRVHFWLILGEPVADKTGNKRKCLVSSMDDEDQEISAYVNETYFGTNWSGQHWCPHDN